MEVAIALFPYHDLYDWNGLWNYKIDFIYWVLIG